MSIILNLADLVNEKNQSSELWQAQRQADRENTNAMQDAGIVQITSDPDAYLRYLNCQADNPSYSAGNVALVMVQDQSATVFGTKDRWKSLMRSVSPTEEKNGVKIYTRSSFGKGYVLTDVYDVRQTSGRDLKHTALQPDSKEMTEALKTLLNYSVVPLVSEESIPLPAIYDPNQMKMAVNPKYNDAEAFAGIATEIAHVRFHAKGYNQNYSRDDYELDAQSTLETVNRLINPYTRDLTLEDMNPAGGFYYYLSPAQKWDTSTQASSWQCELWGAGLTRTLDGGTYVYSGTGDVLKLAFYTSRINYNDDELFYIPDGVYDVQWYDYFPSKEQWVPFTVVQGREANNLTIRISHSWYVHIEDGEITESAPIWEGTMNVALGADDTYTIEMNFKDDAGWDITGTVVSKVTESNVNFWENPAPEPEEPEEPEDPDPGFGQ